MDKKSSKKKTVEVYGDGKTSRDFTPVSDVVEANILSAIKVLPKNNYVFNVGNGRRTSLNQLIYRIYDNLNVPRSKYNLKYKSFRQGDIRHSLASINSIKKTIGFKQTITFDQALKFTIEWFRKND